MGSDTTQKQRGGITGKGFVKGDPRINRNGRPKTFDGLRSLAQDIAHEVVVSKEEPVVINGKLATVTEMILRQWAQSKDARLQQKFIEVAYGKTPDMVEHSGPGGGPIELKVKGYATFSPDDWDNGDKTD